MQTSEETRPDLVASTPPARRGGEEARAQVRGSTWLLVGQLLGIAINLSSQILIVRYLTKESFGAFAFALSVVAVGEVLATFGLRRSVSRFVPIHLERGRIDAAAGVLLFATAAVAALGLVLALVLVLLREPVTDKVGGTHAAAVLAVLVFIIPVTALENLFDAMFAMFRHARLIALRSYVYIPLARMLIVLGLIATGGGVVVLALGYVLAGALGVAVYALMLVGTLRANGLLEPIRARSMTFPVRDVVRFSVPIFTQDFASVLTFAAPVLVLGAVAGAGDVAALRTVFPVALTMLHIRSNFALLFVPMAARLYAKDDTPALDRLYWRSATWMAMFVLPIVLLTVPFGRGLTVFLFGERYASSAPVLAVLVTGIFISLAMGPNLDLLGVYHRVRFIAWSNVASIAVVLALAGTLVGLGAGSVGAAVASAATMAVIGLWWQVGLRRFTGVRAVAGGVPRMLVLTVLGCLALAAVRIALDPPFAAAIALVAVTWLGILMAVRDGLAVDETFPELLRVPLLSRLLSPTVARPATKAT